MATEAKGYWYTPERREAPKFGVRRSRGFTGKRGDRYYYRGQRWLGGSHVVGHMPLGGALVPTAGGIFGLAPIGGDQVGASKPEAAQ